MHYPRDPGSGYGPFPPGTYPIIGFKPGNQFQTPAAYGVGAVLIGGDNSIPQLRGTWVHGYGIWDPKTGAINPSGRNGNSTTNGCIRSENSNIEQIRQMIELNPNGNNQITVVQM